MRRSRWAAKVRALTVIAAVLGLFSVLSVAVSQPHDSSAAAAATPVFAQQVSGHAPSKASLSVTPASAVVTGNRLVVEVGVWSSTNPTTASVTDSAGDVFVELTHFTASDHTEMSVWSAPITKSGGTRPTITATPTRTADIGVAALEYSGLSAVADASVVDQSAQATGNTTSAQTVSSGSTPATTTSNELALGLYTDSGFGDSLAAGAGFTSRVNVSPTGDMELLAEDAVVGQGASPAAAVNTGAQTTWLAATIVFKSAVSSVPTVPAAPLNVTATAGDSSATVSWAAPNNGGSPISSYTITPSTGPVPVVDPATPPVAMIANNATSAASPAFSPPAGAVLYAAVSVDSYPGVPGAHVQSVTNTGSPLIWRFLVNENSNTSSVGSYVEVWWAYNTTAQTNITVSTNFAQAAKNVTPPVGALQVLVLDNAAADQSAAPHASAALVSSTSQTAAVTINAPVASLVLGVFDTWNSVNDPPILPPDQVVEGLVANTVDVDTYWVQGLRQATTIAGPVTLSATLSVSDSWHAAGWVVLPATTAQAPTVVSGSPPPSVATVTGLTNGLAYTFVVTATNAVGAGPPSAASNLITPGPVPLGQGDWPTIEHDPGRSGTATDETQLGPANVASLTQAWSAHLDGKVTAQPLYLSGVQVEGAAHDVVIAATNQNTMYALDANSGSVLWSHHLLAASSNCSIPGGFGITGTPVVDRTAGRIYAVTDDGALRTLSLADGSESAPALLLVPSPATNNVWGGLTLVNGNLYFPTGSNGCDQTPWQGGIYQVGVSGTSPQLVKHWITVPSLPASTAGGGIWGYGGVSVDTTTDHVYAASSDDATNLGSTEGYTPYAGSLLSLDSSLNLVGWYQPPQPANYNCGSSPPCDQDFAATPLVFHPNGCPVMLAAGNKNGQLYVTSEANLESDGGSDGAHVQAIPLNITIDDLGRGGLSGTPVYDPATNLLYVVDTGPGLSGIAGGLVALAVQPDCSLKVAWSQTVGTGISNSPNSTPTVANGVVYVGVNDGSASAFDANSGTLLWNSGSKGFAIYAAPIVANGKLIAGSWNGAGSTDAGTVTAWTPMAGPQLGVSPTSLSFSATTGAPSPAAQTVSLTNLGSGSLSFTASSNAAWLSVAPAGGSVPNTLAVQPNTGGLSPGSYTATVAITPSQGPAQKLGVSLTVNPAPTVPAAPGGVKATAGNASVTVTWTAPANGGSPITSYTVTPFIGTTAQTPTAVSGSPPATTTTVTGLTNGTVYTFTVTATNAVGTGPASAPSNAVTPTSVAIPPAFVQAVSTHAHGSAVAITTASTVAANNRIVVEVGVWNASSATLASVTDSAGNVYSEVTHFRASDQTELSVWSAPITKGGGAKLTVTARPTSAADVGVAVIEYSGLSTAAGASAVDQQSHTTGTTGGASATVASGPTAATTAGNELAIGFYDDSGFGDTLTNGSGWTRRVNVSPTGDMEFLAEDGLVGQGFTPNATVGTGPNTPWLMATIVFKHA